MRRKIKGLVVALAAMGYVSVSVAADPAAVLGKIEGRVLVGQQDTTVTAQEGMRLFTGARVIAVDGGSANVVFADGCAVNLPQNSMLSITGPGQCTAGKALAAKTEGFQHPAIGQSSRIPAWAWWTAGFAAVAGGAIWIANANESDDSSSTQQAAALAQQRAREDEALAQANAARTNALAAEQAAQTQAIATANAAALARNQQRYQGCSSPPCL